MARVAVAYRKDLGHKNREIPTYALSFYQALSRGDHELVTRVGEGHEFKTLEDVPNYQTYDLFIDLDCGRNGRGEQHFRYQDKRCPIPSVLRSIDAHGNPTLHHRVAKNYDHVFFAVWDKRDIFANHPSAHWCPNSSDDTWFDFQKYKEEWDKPQFDFGFFGSKGGLDRANSLTTLCKWNRNYSFDVREVGRAGKARWPRTQKAMARCRFFFNRGQKHDGPNQRVFESMLMNRPLISDRDPRDGMKQLFEEGTHYLGYDTDPQLGIQMDWCKDTENGTLAVSMAQRAYNLVKEKHLVKHRVEQILEVCFGTGSL